MRRTIAPTLALALALLAPAMWGPRAAADPASDAACFLAKANESRAARGYPSLATDPALTTLAGAQAQEMSRISRAVPMDNDTLIAKAPLVAQSLGQNVGVGSDCAGLHETFVSYPADQNRILDPKFDRIGVGVVASGEVIYVSEILMQTGPARPATSKPSVAPAPVVRTPTARAPSPASSLAASPSAVPSPEPSPTPSLVPSESPSAVEVPAVVPSPSESVSAQGASKSRGVPILVAFALMIVGAAALGALVQTRRARR